MKHYSREIKPTPTSLVTDGYFNTGTFNRPFKILNPLDAECYPVPLPRMIRNFRLKEWQAYELGNDDYFIFAVLYKAKSLGLAQFFVYDRQKKNKLLYEKIVPSFSIKLPSSLSGSSGHYKKNNFLIEYNNNIGQNHLQLLVKIHDKHLPRIDAEFNGEYNFNQREPNVAVLPFSKRRAMYSHKCLMPMSGKMLIDNHETVFPGKSSFMIIDHQKSYYPYSCWYNWVTGIKIVKPGSMTGFNLTQNQSPDPEINNENCIWVNGKLHTLPPVVFTHPDGIDGEWLIKDNYGMIDLKFIPEAPGKVDFNLLVLAAHYSAPLGKFRGYIKDSSGKKHVMDDVFGMGEQKQLRM